MTFTPVRRRSGLGTLFIALVLLIVGGYYLLRNTLGFDLPELDSDVVVPVLAVIAGALLLYRYWGERG
jgi:hypothetical protein